MRDDPVPKGAGEYAFANIRRHNERQPAASLEKLQCSKQKINMQSRPAIESKANSLNGVAA